MGLFSNLKEKLYIKLRRTLYLENIDLKLHNANHLQINAYLQKNLYSNEKYANTGRLNKFEFQAFSQFGEDGIIEEIFNRIGTTNKYFVEFGVETGVETNSTYLLYNGWGGLWIDGSDLNINIIKSNFKKSVESGKLNALQSFITAENIEYLFEKASVPSEFDLLSIDIDRNDYYVWDAIKNYKPRVVVIEYNSIFRPNSKFVVPYVSNAIWDGTSNTSASIESLCDLGESKGYKLVGCCFAGVNAFFIREDLINDKFTGPFTSFNYYESPKYFLYHVPGHPRKVIL
jgi:hypothetical protein